MPASNSPVVRSNAVLVLCFSLAWFAAQTVFHLLAHALFALHGFDRVFHETALMLSGPSVFGFAVVLLSPNNEESPEQDHPAEARFLALAACSQDALLLLQAVRGAAGEVEDFCFRFLNGHAAALLRSSPDVLIGRNLCARFPAFRENGVLEAYRRVLESGQQEVLEFAVEDQSINARWLRCSISSSGDGVAISAANLTEHKALEARLVHEVLHDPLTGLPNRTLLDDRLRQLIERSRRHRQTAAVLLLNIDRFSQINGRHGSEAGDQVLKMVAKRLSAVVRSTDSVFRLAGDQFVILFGDLLSGEPIADFERKVLASLVPPVRLQQLEIPLDVSIGTAAYPLAGSSPETLLVQADIAMNGMRRQHDDTRALAARDRELDRSAFHLSVG